MSGLVAFYISVQLVLVVERRERRKKERERRRRLARKPVFMARVRLVCAHGLFMRAFQCGVNCALEVEEAEEC